MQSDNCLSNNCHIAKLKWLLSKKIWPFWDSNWCWMTFPCWGQSNKPFYSCNFRLGKVSEAVLFCPCFPIVRAQNKLAYWQSLWLDAKYNLIGWPLGTLSYVKQLAMLCHLVFNCISSACTVKWATPSMYSYALGIKVWASHWTTKTA